MTPVIEVADLRSAIKANERVMDDYLTRDPSTNSPYAKEQQEERTKQALQMIREKMTDLTKEERMRALSVIRRRLADHREVVTTQLQRGVDEHMQKLDEASRKNIMKKIEEIDALHSATVDREREHATFTEQVGIEAREVKKELKEGDWKTWAKYGTIAVAAGVAGKWLYDHTIGWLWDKTIGDEEHPGFMRRASSWVAAGGAAMLGLMGIRAASGKGDVLGLGKYVPEEVKDVSKGANKGMNESLEKLDKWVIDAWRKGDAVWIVAGPVAYLVDQGGNLLYKTYAEIPSALVQKDMKTCLQVHGEGMAMYGMSFGVVEAMLTKMRTGQLSMAKFGLKTIAWEATPLRWGVGIAHNVVSGDAKLGWQAMTGKHSAEFLDKLASRYQELSAYSSGRRTLTSVIGRDTDATLHQMEKHVRAVLFEMQKEVGDGVLHPLIQEVLGNDVAHQVRSEFAKGKSVGYLRFWNNTGNLTALPDALLKKYGGLNRDFLEKASNAKRLFEEGKTASTVMAQTKCEVRHILAATKEFDETRRIAVVADLLSHGESAEHLLRNGFSASHLLGAGQTLSDVEKALKGLNSLERAMSLEELLKSGKVALKDLVSARMPTADLLRAGAEPAEMMKLGAGAEDFVRADLSLKDFVKAGGSEGVYKTMAQTIRAETAMAENPAVKTMLTRLAGKLSPAELKNLEQSIKFGVKPGLIEAFAPGSRAENLLIGAAKSKDAEKEVARIFRAAEKASTAGKAVAVGGALFEAALLYFDYQEYKEKAEQTSNEELKQLYKQSFVLKARQTATTVVGVAVGGGAAAWMLGGTFMAGAIAPAGCILLPVAAATFAFREAQKNLEYAAEFYLMDDKQLKEFSPGKLLAQVDEDTPGRLATLYPWFNVPTMEELNDAKNAANVHRIWAYLAKRAETLFPVMPGLPREVEQETFEYRRTFVLDTFNYLRALQQGKTEDKKYFNIIPAEFEQAEAYAKMNAGLRQNGKPFDQLTLANADTMKGLQKSLEQSMSENDEATMNFLSSISQSATEFNKAGLAIMLRLLTHDLANADKRIVGHDYSNWGSWQGWRHWSSDAEMQAVVRGAVADKLWESLRKIVSNGPMTPQQARTAMTSLRDQLAHLGSPDALAERTADKDWTWMKNIGRFDALLTPEGMQWYLHRYPVAAPTETTGQDIVDIHGLHFYSRDERATLTLKNGQGAHISGVKGYYVANARGDRTKPTIIDKEVETFAPGAYVFWSPGAKPSMTSGGTMTRQSEMILEIKA